MDTISNEEYIKKLKSILEEEKAKEAEEIQMPDYNIEIQSQFQETQSLENEIQNFQKNFKKNNINTFDFELKKSYINELQNKVVEDITLKLNSIYNQYENNIKEKIFQMKKNINEQSEKIINLHFGEVLNEITKNNDKIKQDLQKNKINIIEKINSPYKEAKLNADKLEDKEIKEPSDSSGKKAQKKIERENTNKVEQNGKMIENNNLNKFSYKKGEEILDRIHNSKMDMNKYINKKGNDNEKGIKRINKQNNNIQTNKDNRIDMNNSNNNIKTSKMNSNDFDSKNYTSKNYYYEKAHIKNNEYNKDNNNFDPIDGKKNKEKKLNNSNKPQYKEKNNDNNRKNGEENIIDDDNADDSINQINNRNIGSKPFINVNANNFNRASNIFKRKAKNNNNELNSLNNLHNQNKKPTTINYINISNQNMNEDIKKGNKTLMIPIAKEMENQKKGEKKKVRKIYTSVNKIFYSDYQQKYLKVQKINDIEKEELENEITKGMRNNNEDLIKYCLNYIEENVLKLFKRKDLNDEQREILKFNIETVLKICGKDKNIYRDFYYPETRVKPKVVDRGRSIEALQKFRKEFSISDKDYADEGLLNRLIENNLDIYKTFEKIFGV